VADAIGGGVAPGRRGSTVQQTEVARIPMWVPWDQGGEGSWRLIPADTTHASQLVTTDSNSAMTGRPARLAEPLYQAKGMVPEHRAPVDKLPLLVGKAQRAIEQAASELLPPPQWAVGVLNRHADLVAKPKASAGAGV
jgi:hypothetical protein